MASTKKRTLEQTNIVADQQGATKSQDEGKAKEAAVVRVKAYTKVLEAVHTLWAGKYWGESDIEGPFSDLAAAELERVRILEWHGDDDTEKATKEVHDEMEEGEEFDDDAVQDALALIQTDRMKNDFVYMTAVVEDPGTDWDKARHFFGTYRLKMNWAVPVGKYGADPDLTTSAMYQLISTGLLPWHYLKSLDAVSIFSRPQNQPDTVVHNTRCFYDHALQVFQVKDGIRAEQTEALSKELRPVEEAMCPDGLVTAGVVYICDVIAEYTMHWRAVSITVHGSGFACCGQCVHDHCLLSLQ